MRTMKTDSICPSGIYTKLDSCFFLKNEGNSYYFKRGKLNDVVSEVHVKLDEFLRI